MTTTQTLADFLLARIAEDEAALEADDCQSLGIHVITVAAGERWLAECEAKRRIVDTAERMVLDADDRNNHMSAQERFMTARISRHLLVALAAVYADHEDFRQEWRP